MLPPNHPTASPDTPRSQPHPRPAHGPPAPGAAASTPPPHHWERVAARLLDSPARRDILVAVSRRPGQTVGEIQEALDMGWGTLHHHLRRLEHGGHLHTVSAGRRRLVFPGPSASAPAARGKGRAILRGRTARRVAEGIARHPGLAIDRLVPLVQESPRAVYYHVKRLVDAGLVLSERTTRYADLSPTPELRVLLAEENASTG